MHLKFPMQIKGYFSHKPKIVKTEITQQKCFLTYLFFLFSKIYSLQQFHAIDFFSNRFVYLLNLCLTTAVPPHFQFVKAVFSLHAASFIKPRQSMLPSTLNIDVLSGTKWVNKSWHADNTTPKERQSMRAFVMCNV